MAELIQIARGVSAIRFMLTKPHVRIGRGHDNDICLSDAFVSKEHAIIETRPSDQLPGIYEFYLRDLGSTNHTFVNKTQISYQQLHNNDTVHIGHNEFRFICSKNELDHPGAPPQEQATGHAACSLFTEEEHAHNANNTSDASFSRRLNLLQ